MAFTEYRKLAEPLPDAVPSVPAPARGSDLVHVRATRPQGLAAHVAELRRQLGPVASVWVFRPNKAAKVSSEVSKDIVRETALALGFVDVKVCAAGEVRSGLKLAVRKELR